MLNSPDNYCGIVNVFKNIAKDIAKENNNHFTLCLHDSKVAEKTFDLLIGNKCQKIEKLSKILPEIYTEFDLNHREYDSKKCSEKTFHRNKLTNDNWEDTKEILFLLQSHYKKLKNNYNCEILLFKEEKEYLLKNKTKIIEKWKTEYFKDLMGNIVVMCKENNITFDLKTNSPKIIQYIQMNKPLHSNICINTKLQKGKLISLNMYSREPFLFLNPYFFNWSKSANSSYTIMIKKKNRKNIIIQI
jgi:hypothetical protein